MMAELQDVFASYWDDYQASHRVSHQQEKAAHAITVCRTAELGGHVEVCDTCGHERISYNSCRNRHCPKCQATKRETWVQARLDDLLDTVYFHVVFTVPDCLDELFRSNEKAAYSALFRASADTLLELAADKRHLGCKVGFTSVLHTSGQNLGYHPHIHAVVCAGGIDEHGTFRHARRKFFIPVKVLSRVFRGKLTETLKGLTLTIRGFDDPKRIADAIALSWEREWVVYCKRPFRDAACVIGYLGRYTHKTAISNSRILKVGDGKVTFKWRDYRDNNKIKVMALGAGEFIRRFLTHVLPSGFMRIRHYGFLANNGKRKRIDHLRRLCNMAPRQTAKLSGLQIACKLVGRDITRCSVCGGMLRPPTLPVRLC
jgi:hypothetical protein